MDIKWIETYVAGVQHYDAKEVFKQVKDLLFENDVYTWSKNDILDIYDDGDKIYKYEPYFLEFRLEHEPTNEHDPNAVKVIVTEFEKEYMIGYVPSKYALRIMKSLDNKIKPSLVIVGGAYKMVDDDSIKSGKTDLSFELSFGE